MHDPTADDPTADIELIILILLSSYIEDIAQSIPEFIADPYELLYLGAALLLTSLFLFYGAAASLLDENIDPIPENNPPPDFFYFAPPMLHFIPKLCLYMPD